VKNCFQIFFTFLKCSQGQGEYREVDRFQIGPTVQELRTKRFRGKQVVKLRHGGLRQQHGQLHGLGPGGWQIRGEGSLGQGELAGEVSTAGCWPWADKNGPLSISAVLARRKKTSPVLKMADRARHFLFYEKN